ncbi:MAG TPA: DUF2269 domain-containing protein [Pelotomaculum sp.]|nr:DUF2269 domain-containing protein [Pelotomaculum sp.]
MNAAVFIWISLTMFGLVSILVLVGNAISRKKLSNKQKNCWLIAHIFFIIIAFSGLIGQLLLANATAFLTDREHLFAAHLFIVYFDDYLIIPGAFGSFITGIWLAVRTHWGFTKHYWIIAKWIGNIAAILLGSAIIGGRIHHAFPEILSNSIHPLQNPAYFYSLKILFIGIIISLAIFVFLVVISILKPWGKRKPAQGDGSVNGCLLFDQM